MRLTNTLCKQSLTFLWKKLYEARGKLKEPTLAVPQFVKDRGIKVVDGKDIMKEPEPEPWTPPVSDDPRFSKKKTEKDDPDYHESSVYEFSTDTTLIEGVKQALILTKSNDISGMPEVVKQLVGKTSFPDQDELVQRFIMQANVWDTTKEKLPRRSIPADISPIWRFKAEWGIPRMKRNSILLRNIVRLSAMIAGSSQQDFLLSRCTTTDHFVSAFYFFEGTKHIWIRGQNEVMVSADKPLDMFASASEVKQFESSELPNIFPIAPTIDFKRQHIWRKENITGWKKGFSHNHPHTLYYNMPDNATTSVRNARALLFCFANALASAKNRFGMEAKSLPEPVCTQCVATDGETFDFVYFQLNTLDFTSAQGVKNLVWFDNDNLMYNKIIPRRSMLRNTRYEDYNPEVMKKLVATYMFSGKPASVAHHAEPSVAARASNKA